MSIFDDMAEELYGSDDESLNTSFDYGPYYNVAEPLKFSSADHLIATPDDWLDSILWIKKLPQKGGV